MTENTLLEMPAPAEQKLERILKMHQLGKITRKDTRKELDISEKEYFEIIKGYKEKNSIINIKDELKGLDYCTVFSSLLDNRLNTEYLNFAERYNLFGKGDKKSKVKNSIKKLLKLKQEGKIEAKDFESDKERLELIFKRILEERATYAIRKLSDYNIKFELFPQLIFELPQNIAKMNYKDAKKFNIKEKKTAFKKKYNEEIESDSFKEYFLDRKKMFYNDYNKLRKFISDSPFAKNILHGIDEVVSGFSFKDLDEKTREDIYIHWHVSGYGLPKKRTVERFHLKDNKVLYEILDYVVDLRAKK